MRIEPLKAAQERIHPYLTLPSPVLPLVNAGNVFFKLETLQPTASFKVRPALNGILAHLPAARARGVITSSSGNFAQAVAWASNTLRISAHIVMMSNTAPIKIEKTRARGANITLCPPTFEARWETTARLQQQTGRVLLHPYDSEETIAANGTIGLELIAQLTAPFTALVPVSGGGLLAGIALAIKTLSPSSKVIGVQQTVNASLKKSLAHGARIKVDPFQSSADALVALTPGEKTFELIQSHVDDVVLVDETWIQRTTDTLASRHQLFVEPAGGITYGALLAGAYRPRPEERVVCVLSGANR